ncbi:MAG: hypothetical protein AAFY00_03625, partial [Bacteroidota bacterium]
MSIEIRKRIAYWFFLLAGLAGVSFQMYEFFTGHIDFTLTQIGVTSFFTVFMFRPTVLLDVFEFVK